PSDEYLASISSTSKFIFNKLDINQQTNETLEAMAQTIFKSWFVDFDPVRAKIEAKSAGGDPSRAAMAAISACTKVSADGAVLWDETEAALEQKLAGMSEAQELQLTRTAELFPDELGESEVGMVPKGWENENLGKICNVQGGYAFKSKLFKEQGCPVVKIKNINEDYTVDLKNGQFLSKEDCLDKETYELNDGDYVLAMTGATVGKSGIIVSNEEKVMLNQRVAKFESDQFESNINWFIHSAFLATNLKDQIVNLARGSAQPNISASGIESANLIIPQKVIIEEFLKIADPLFKKWIGNYKQNETLSGLRDTLLPKLISGEVGV
ncbi:MAG: restriction endonuclease subunit S, partial [Psychroflexus sp.]